MLEKMTAERGDNIFEELGIILQVFSRGGDKEKVAPVREASKALGQ
jgi:hypothetical protein